MLRRQQMLPPESAASLLCASCASSLPLVYQSLSLIPLSRPPLTAPDSVSLVSLTGRMQRLRRSFSLDFVNDDTATVFLNDDPDHEPSGGRGSGSHHNHHHSLTTDPKCLLVSNHGTEVHVVRVY